MSLNPDWMPNSIVDSEAPGLWIRKQPSGGRGEYEVVGRQEGVSARDLDGREFELITPFGTKESGVYLGSQGGKRRLRLQQKRGAHIQRQLAALFLLPKSTREESKVSSALPVILEGRYILDIGIRLEKLNADVASITPLVLLARSGEHTDVRSMSSIDTQERYQQLSAVYASRAKLPSILTDLLEKHLELSADAHPSYGDLERIVQSITEELTASPDLEYVPGSDPLPVLGRLTGTNPEDLFIPPPPLLPDGDLELKRRSEHIYRMTKIRGSKAAKFRDSVQQAYDYRCAFCGFRAPRIAGRALSGVDAAHILPWGEYELDVVSNGLMLCKLHHWAFDSHILILEVQHGQYHVSLADDVNAIFSADPQTLSLLQTAVGEIPDDRLPPLPHRPSVKFINELYSVTS